MSLDLKISFRNEVVRKEDSAMPGIPNSLVEHAWLSGSSVMTEDGPLEPDVDSFIDAILDSVDGVLGDVEAALQIVDGVSGITDDYEPMDETAKFFDASVDLSLADEDVARRAESAVRAAFPESEWKLRFQYYDDSALVQTTGWEPQV